MVALLIAFLVLTAVVIFADAVHKLVSTRGQAITVEADKPQQETEVSTSTEEQNVSPSPVSGVSVEAEVAEENQEENQMRRDIYSFTIDIKTFVRNAMNDPSVLADIKEAIKEGPLPPTEMLGACNLKDADEDADNWYTVFPATTRGTEPGQPGYLARNNNGSRISFRLRRQERKNHAASSKPQPEPNVGAATAQLLALAMSGDQEAAAAILALAGNVVTPQITEQGQQLTEAQSEQSPPSEVGQNSSEQGLDEFEDLFGAEVSEGPTAVEETTPSEEKQETPQESEALAAAEESHEEASTDSEAELSSSDEEDDLIL